MDPARELLPYVDNVSLVDLVSGYERAACFDVPGAYAGVVLDHFNCQRRLKIDPQTTAEF